MNKKLLHILKMFEGRRFQYGLHDCCLFPSDVFLMLRGFDPAAQWRGTYGGLRGAIRLLRKHDGLHGLVGASGLVEIPRLQMSVGDFVIALLPIDVVSPTEQHLKDTEHGQFVAGICMGDTYITAARPKGFVARPIREVRSAWAV